MEQVFRWVLAGMVIGVVYLVPLVVRAYRRLRKVTTEQPRPSRILEWIVGLLAVSIVFNHNFGFRLYTQQAKLRRFPLKYGSGLSLGIALLLVALVALPV